MAVGVGGIEITEVLNAHILKRRVHLADQKGARRALQTEKGITGGPDIAGIVVINVDLLLVLPQEHIAVIQRYLAAKPDHAGVAGNAQIAVGQQRIGVGFIGAHIGIRIVHRQPQRAVDLKRFMDSAFRVGDLVQHLHRGPLAYHRQSGGGENGKPPGHNGQAGFLYCHDVSPRAFVMVLRLPCQTRRFGPIDLCGHEGR